MLDLSQRWAQSQARLNRLHQTIRTLSLKDGMRLRSMMLGTLCIHVEDELWDLSIAEAIRTMRSLDSASAPATTPIDSL
jgi:hypothetical protein